MRGCTRGRHFKAAVSIVNFDAPWQRQSAETVTLSRNGTYKRIGRCCSNGEELAPVMRDVVKHMRGLDRADWRDAK